MAITITGYFMSDNLLRLLVCLVATMLILGLCCIGTYLVILEHYGWAWIPFVISMGVSVRSHAKK